MRALIGPHGSETVSPATRVTSNGSGRVGETSDLIRTHGTADAGQWETYQGTYRATGTLTRFTSESIKDGIAGEPTAAEGNCIDDISFTISYPLADDANGETCRMPGA